MSKYIYIKTANDQAYMNTAANFRGAIHSGDTAIDLYFNSAGSGVAGAFDKIPLVVTTQKEQEVMDNIGGALAGSHSKGMVVIADDIASKYVNANITAVGAFSLASTGVMTKRNVELVTATDALTEAESGTKYVFNDADGAVLTLPDSGGGGSMVGVFFDFYINVTATSNAHKVVCADTTNEVMFGMLANSDVDTSDAAINFAAIVGDGFSAINCNGTTTGVQGSSWRITCIAADKWQVEANILSTGTTATSFAAS